MATVGTDQVISSETVNATATVYSDWWVQTRLGDLLTVFVIIESATTPEVDVYLDVSPLTSSISATSTDLTGYAPISLESALSTKAELQRYAAADYAFPSAQARVRIVGTASNGTDTVVSAYICLASGDD